MGYEIVRLSGAAMNVEFVHLPGPDKWIVRYGTPTTNTVYWRGPGVSDVFSGDHSNWSFVKDYAMQFVSEEAARAEFTAAVLAS